MTERPLRVLLACALLTGAVACREEGPAERAGERIDEAVDDVRDRAEEAGEDLDRKMDEVSDEARRAAERMKDAAKPDPGR